METGEFYRSIEDFDIGGLIDSSDGGSIIREYGLNWLGLTDEEDEDSLDDDISGSYLDSLIANKKMQSAIYVDGQLLYQYGSRIARGNREEYIIAYGDPYNWYLVNQYQSFDSLEAAEEFAKSLPSHDDYVIFHAGNVAQYRVNGTIYNELTDAAKYFDPGAHYPNGLHDYAQYYYEHIIDK